MRNEQQEIGIQETRIKNELKLRVSQLDKEKQYDLFIELGDLYLSKAEMTDEDLRIYYYPKAAAIYRYAYELAKQLTNTEAKHEFITHRLINIEKEFFDKTGRIIPEFQELQGRFNNVQNLKNKLKEFRKLYSQSQVVSEEFTQQKVDEVKEKYLRIREKLIGKEGIFIQLLDSSIKELGGLPKVAGGKDCRVTIFCMGSMASGTTTFWSDIEWGIFFEDDLTKEEEIKVKKFFRELTALLFIKIINFGETILPSMEIKELNDSTSPNPLEDNWFYDTLMPRGISYDGLMPKACKLPWGKRNENNPDGEELIGTPKELAKFHDENHWNQDEQMTQAMSNIIKITGDGQLIEEYYQEVRNIVSANDRKARTFKILQNDLKVYNPWQQMEFENEGAFLNIKKEIYRYPDRIIAALHELLSNSKFDNLWDFIDNCEYFSPEAKNQLKIALTIACELRLNIYAANNGQRETAWAFTPKDDKILEEVRTKNMEKVFCIKDPKLLYNFFHIALCLSTFFANNKLDLIANQTFIASEKDKLICAGLIAMRLMDYGFALDKFHQAANLIQKEGKLHDFELLSIIYKQVVEALFRADKLSNMEPYIEKFKEVLEYFPEKSNKKHQSILEYMLYRENHLKGKYKVAFKHATNCKQIRKELLETEKDSSNYHNLDYLDELYSNTAIITCYHGLSQFSEAINLCNEIKDKFSQIPNKRYYANFLISFADNYFEDGQYKQALKKYEDALDIYISTMGNLHHMVLSIKEKLGTTYFQLGELGKAEEYLTLVRTYTKSTYGTANRTYLDATITLSDIYSKNDVERAAALLNEAKDSCDQVHEENSLRHAIIFQNLGKLYKQQKRYDLAKECLNKSYEIRKNKLGEAHLHCAVVKYYLNKVYWETKEYKDIFPNYMYIIKIFKRDIFGHTDYKKLMFRICMALAEIETWDESKPGQDTIHTLNQEVADYIKHLNSQIKDFIPVLQNEKSNDEFSNEAKSQIKTIIGNKKSIEEDIIYIKNLADIYQAQKKYDLAIQCRQLIVAIRTICNDQVCNDEYRKTKFFLAQAIDELRKIYYTTNKPEQAEKSYMTAHDHIKEIIDKCYENNNLDLLITYQERLIDIAPLSEYKNQLACFHHAKALHCKKKGDIRLYEYHFEKAKNIFDESVPQNINEVKAGDAVEYAMFYLKHPKLFNKEKYEFLLPHLRKAMTDSSANHNYALFERIILIPSLYDIVENNFQRECIVQIDSKVLASCLIIESLLTLKDYKKANMELENLKKIIENPLNQPDSLVISRGFIEYAEEKLHPILQHEGHVSRLKAKRSASSLIGRTN